MADRRPKGEDGSGRAKRRKTEDSDPKMNPYLAHMYDEHEDDDAEYNTGYSNGNGYGNGVSLKKDPVVGDSTGWAKMPRHHTTADMAMKAEDGPSNAFNGEPLSQKYFNILKSRRNLPVHAQRYAATLTHDKLVLTDPAETNSSACTKSRRS